MRWVRVMAGEYQGHVDGKRVYDVYYVYSGCPTCDHHHEGWELSYREHGRTYRHQFDSFRLAKVAAELHAKAVSA